VCLSTIGRTLLLSIYDTEEPTLMSETRVAPQLLTVEQAAEALHIGRAKAWTLVASGEIQSVTIGRLRRITPAAIDRYIARLQDLAASA